MKIHLMLAAACIALAGCAGSVTLTPTGTTPPSSDALTKLAAFTLTDLANADADAVAHNDVIAHACYPALSKFVADLQGTGVGGTVSGAFGSFQRARDLANQTASGLPDYLKLGCAPLFVDANAMILRMAALAAVVAPK